MRPVSDLGGQETTLNGRFGEAHHWNRTSSLSDILGCGGQPGARQGECWRARHVLHTNTRLTWVTRSTLLCTQFMSLHQIARDEELDLIDPLRHFMRQVDESDSDLPLHPQILPDQPHSIHNETLDLTFFNQQQASITISLAVDASPGCGGIAWPAGEVCLDLTNCRTLAPLYTQVLSRYIVKKGMAYIKDKTVLELGSGTGLVGLVAAKLGGKVWITDQAFAAFPTLPRIPSHP